MQRKEAEIREDPSRQGQTTKRIRSSLFLAFVVALFLLSIPPLQHSSSPTLLSLLNMQLTASFTALGAFVTTALFAAQAQAQITDSYAFTRVSIDDTFVSAF